MTDRFPILRIVGFVVFYLLVCAALVALLSSCSPKAPPPQAPSSSLTKAQAVQMAAYAAMSAKDTELFEVTSRSMVPTLDQKTILVLLPCTVADLRPGDIVVYRTARGNLSHRIVAVGPRGCETRGDNNPSTDSERVTDNNLIGRATAVIYSQ